MASTQNNFQVVGKNLIIISNLLLNNQNICKLIHYTTRTPLLEATITDTDFLMDKNIRLIPKVPDEQSEKGSFIIILLDSFDLDPKNASTLMATLRFDVICPIDEWLIDEESLRPFMIMSEIQEMFNGLQIKGIGKLRFNGVERIVLSEIYAGYTMVFTNYEFT